MQPPRAVLTRRVPGRVPTRTASRTSRCVTRRVLSRNLTRAATCAAACLLLVRVEPAFTATAVEAEFLLAASRADLTGMPAYFAAIDGTSDPLLRALRDGFEGRFLHRSESLSPQTGSALIDGLVTAFRHYWVEALLDPAAGEAAAARLQERLQALVPAEPSSAALTGRTPAGPFARAARAAEAAGYGVSIAVAAPLHDLVIWSGEERAHYRVELTDGVETVEVVFIDGLISGGWREFASLGLSSTSGWTGGDALYCIRGAYDTASERFRVSYLKHEARHFADFRRYPGLDETTMEYRAKLTELAYAGYSAGDMLRRFSTGRSAAGPDAHARANERVSADLYQALFGRPMPENPDAWPMPGPDRINPAAWQLLERNTAEWERARRAVNP